MAHVVKELEVVLSERRSWERPLERLCRDRAAGESDVADLSNGVKFQTSQHSATCVCLQVCTP